MMFGKMSKHQYVGDNVLSNMVELFVSNRAWNFAVCLMLVEVGVDYLKNKFSQY
jgi:hypothetical protein